MSRYVTSLGALAGVKGTKKLSSRISLLAIAIGFLERVPTWIFLLGKCLLCSKKALRLLSTYLSVNQSEHEVRVGETLKFLII